MKITEEQLIRSLGPLSDLEIEYLSLILVHGLIVKSTWVGLPSAQTRSHVELAKAMWQLTNRRILIARPLYHGRNYFALSPASQAKLGLPVSKKALSDSALIRLFARLMFFTEADPNCFKLEPEQLSRKLDGEPTFGLPPGFYGRNEDSEFLGFLRIDGHLGTTSKRLNVIRAAQVLRHDIFRLVKFRRIQERLMQKKFEVTWITASQARADAVLQQFRQYKLIGKAPIRPLVVPELVNFAPKVEKPRWIHLVRNPGS